MENNSVEYRKAHLNTVLLNYNGTLSTLSRVFVHRNESGVPIVCMVERRSHQCMYMYKSD